MADLTITDKLDPNGPGLNDSHLIFLETMAKLWPITLERHKRMTGIRQDCSDLDIAQKEIVAEATIWYKRITWIRLLVAKLYQESEPHRKAFDERGRSDSIWWIDNFVWTFDPRLPPIGLPANVPMVLWPEQKRILTEFIELYKNGLPCIVEKSRETGISWLFTSFLMHEWLYVDGFKGTLASRDERQVDERGNMDTLFGKARHLLYLLPVSMRPSSFEKMDGAHDKLKNINNPDRNSAIIGESGDNIGRGGRSSITLVDEAAYLEHYESTDSALSHNTHCQLEVSTPNGMNPYYRKRMGGGVRVLTMRWFADPSKNGSWRDGVKPISNAWYEYHKLKNIHDPTIVAREIDIDYNASMEGAFIPAAWVTAAVRFNLEASGEKVAGFDVAGGGKNEAVYTKRIGPVVFPCRVMHHETSTENIYDALRFGEEDGINRLNYDHDGIGESVFGLVKTQEIKLKFKIFGVRGGAGATEDVDDASGLSGKERFRNKRAENWWSVRERFRKTYEHVHGIKFYSAAEMISIPDDNVLISQLSSPKVKPAPSGKIQVESKIDMKRRGVESPDRADALVYAFVDSDDSVVDGFDYTDSKQYSNFDIDEARRFGSQQYVSLLYGDDLEAHVVVCLWWPSSKRPLLQVVHEYVGGGGVHTIVSDVRSLTFGKEVQEWIGNEELFATPKDAGKLMPWFHFKREGVSLHRNYSNDDVGALMLVNQMFRGGMIQVHTNCERLMLQLANWKESSKNSFGLASALCQLVTRLRKKRELTEKQIDMLNHNGAYGHFGRTAVSGTDMKKVLAEREKELWLANR